MLAVTNARVFDGDHVLERATVLVDNGVIVSVDDMNLAPPADAEVIDATGMTLLPGLTDSHVHTFGDALQRAVVFGVTTVLDMHTDPTFAAEMRAGQSAGLANDRADLFSAGFGATCPGGHGTQYGMIVPTLTSADDADGWVADRVADGSDYIKILIEDGHTFGRTTPCLAEDTIEALIAAAHRHGKLAVVHPAGHLAAHHAVASGADGLVHLFVDERASNDFVALVAAGNTFVIPTLTVFESTRPGSTRDELIAHPDLEGFLDGDETTNLVSSFAVPDTATYDYAADAVKRLHSAGVRILAGSDAPNPGTSHGVSVHRELELLVHAGLSPTDALRAATANPAEAFGLPDRGRIIAGARADLFLVSGDPTRDIRATRAIRAVWKGGVAVNRERRRHAVAAARAAAIARRTQPGPPGSDSGMVADFEDDRVSTRFGQLAPSTDEIAGGNSTVALRVVAPGAGGSQHALSIAAEIRGGAPYTWAGVLFMAGERPLQPANLSKFTRICFACRAPQGPVSVQVMSYREAMTPAGMTTVALTEDWRDVTVELHRIGAGDASAIVAILWSAPPTQGAYTFELDDIRFE